jgi:hypothetical protein
MAMFWHDRQDSDPVHAFLRMEVTHVAAALPAPAGKARHRNRESRFLGPLGE